jgi:hypothetical protein
MAAVNDTIGTTGRDFSTITLWETSLSAHSGDDCTGTCYDDSDFNEAVTLNDTTPTSVVLTAAAGERHDGIANAVSGSGVRILGASNRFVYSTPAAIVEWIDKDHNGSSVISDAINLNTSSAVVLTLQKCIVHDIVDTSTAYGIVINDPSRVLNCIIYDVTSGGAGQASGIYVLSGSTDEASIYNCTVDRSQNNSIGNVYCYHLDDDNAAKNIKNCAGTAAGGTTSGSKAAFKYAGVSNSTIDYCLDDDSTLPAGVNNQRGVTVGDQYTSRTDGAENYLPKAGSTCIDNGVDLGTTPANVNVDARNRDRDAEGDTWDIGAIEVVPAGGNAPTGHLYGPLVGPFGGAI